jgi:hypothetical protein
MKNLIISSQNLRSDEYLHTEIRKKYTRGRFIAMGYEMNAYELTLEFNKHEQMVMKIMVDNWDFVSGMVSFSSGTLSSTDKVKFSKGYKLLAEKNIILRIRKGLSSSYMVNPDYIMPKDYVEAKDKWKNYISL